MTATTFARGKRAVLPEPRNQRFTMPFLLGQLNINCRLRRLCLFDPACYSFLVQWRDAGENDGLYLIACLCTASDHNGNESERKHDHHEQSPHGAMQG